MTTNIIHLMRKQNTLPWPRIILLMVGSFLLIWSSYRLSYYAVQEILQIFTSNDNVFYQLVAIAATVFLLALALLLLYVGYVVIASLWDWPIPFLAKTTDTLSEEEMEPIYIGPRNTYILLLAALGSYYMLFLQHSQNFDFYWALFFPLPILLVNWRSAQKYVLYVLGILGVLAFICTIKLNIQYNAYLLSSLPPFFSASLLSYLLVGLWVHYHVKRVPDHKSLLEYRLVLTFLLGTLCIFYFYSMLTVINCRYDSKKSAVKYKAIVMEKCPPYGDYTLSLSYQKGDRFRGMLLPVSARFYHQIKEGDTITLQLHSGLFGWPWYHDGMGKRDVHRKQHPIRHD